MVFLQVIRYSKNLPQINCGRHDQPRVLSFMACITVSTVTNKIYRRSQLYENDPIKQ